MQEPNTPIKFIASSGWSHIFVGRSESVVRWSLDLAKGELLQAQVRGELGEWFDIGVDMREDLMEDLKTNLEFSSFTRKDADDWCLDAYEALPEHGVFPEAAQPRPRFRG